MDDLIIYSTIWEEHQTHLREVLKRLGLTVKPLKCQVAIAGCTYLGQVEGSGVVKPVASKIQAVNQYPQPTTKKQVCLFLEILTFHAPLSCRLMHLK